MTDDLSINIRMATDGINAFGKAIGKTQIRVVRFFDALVDGGVIEPPFGYWEHRLIREIARRSFRARVGRIAARMVAKSV